MAGLDSRHVTWGHLQYYDTQIKKFVEDAVATLEQSTVTPEETAAITKKLNEVEQLATVNRANIEAIVAVNKDQEARITTLFTYNTTTKEDLATQTARIDSIKEDLSRLEESLKHDHKTIEDIRIVLENKADKSYVEDVIKNIPQISLANYFTKDEVLQLIPNVEHLATKEELAIVDGKINTALDDIKELENKTETDHKTIEEIQLALKGDYYTKDEVEDLLPDTSAFVTTPELEAAIDNCATEAEVTSLIQEIADVQEQLDEKANIEDIPSIQGLATEEFVVKKIAEAELADQDVDLSAYYTKSETEAVVKAAVDAINVPDVSNLATKEELEAVQNVAGSNSVKLFAIESDLVDISNQLENIPTTYATKDEVAAVEAKVDAIVIPEVPTKVSELENDAGYLTEHQDISGKADKSDLVGLATESYVNTAIENIPEVDLSDYATQQFVLDKIAEVPTDYLKEVPSEYITESELSEELAKIEHPTVDLTGYATEQWVNEQGFIKEVPSDYITESELDAKGYLTEHQDISHLATKDEVPSIDGLATETYVDEKFAEIVVPDVSGFATKEELEEAINNIEHPTVDLSDYYTKAEVDEAIANVEHPTVDLEGYATEQWVKDELAKIDPSIPSEYITETELLEKGYITNSALTDYAKADSIPTKTSQLTNDSNFLTEHQDISGKADRSDLEGLASTDYVDQAIANIPETDVSNLATKSELESVEAKIPTDYLTTIPEEYVTKQELDSEGFVKSLDGYATEQFVTDAISNIKHPDPDLSNYYTKDETTSAINEAIDGIKIPEVNLDPYATKAQVAEQIATKADNVPFTTDMFVTSELGNFAYGDNLNGLSVTTILTKLLGLQATIVPGEPENPEEPQSIAEKIIANEIPMYSIDLNGELSETSFNLIDGTAEPTESGFYTIRDIEGNIIEAGYQDLTIKNDEMYYIMALPNELDYNTNVRLQSWDPDEAVWVDAELDLTSDSTVVDTMCNDAGVDITHIDKTKYTVWVVTGNSDPLCTGSILRYIIVEE